MKPQEMDDGIVDEASRLVQAGDIDRGGMGIISEVYDANLQRRLAMKRLRPDLASDYEARRNLAEEARITALLEHPYVIPVHELGIRDGQLYFTMKIAGGADMIDLIRPPREWMAHAADYLFPMIQIVIKICEALIHAHAHGVIHRDIKPENIRIGDHGQVFLLDWGIALRRKPEGGLRHVRSDRLLVSGTPAYMAPEQAAGSIAAIDERTDVFGVGALLYTIITGRAPFDAETKMDSLMLASEGNVEDPRRLAGGQLPPRLARIALKALSREKAERHQSMAELKTDLEAFLQSGWNFERRSYGPGDPIVAEGDMAEEAFIIVHGRCGVYKQVEGERIQIRELGEHEVFGETAVFGNQPRTATVTALEPVVVRVVSRAQLEDLGLGFWLTLFVRALAERFIDKETECLELRQARESDRVRARFLVRMALSGEAREGRRCRAGRNAILSSVAEETGRSVTEVEAIIVGMDEVRIDTAHNAIELVSP